MKMLEYEMANPGQDRSSEDAAAPASYERAESFV